LGIGKGPVLRSFSYRKQSWDFFTFLEIVTVWLVPSAGQKIPVEPGWYLPRQKIPLAENRFLHAGNGAENTKEKSNPGSALLTARGLVMIFLQRQNWDNKIKTPQNWHLCLNLA
jgi:hypothetical protein